nr:bis(5'-nucleosyl)-tetraphosphatase [asymmetrical]-like [Cherax quadricarinatus]XP_053648317.1 bis(5'-nucleosyl)-tetraphosphatase [asymmetrical]-like [Cherax quadricarinatus]XP_053648318.1 bis(5'-nucleosyl)-tetraphosphatase [asymmetrical]-like [Cherax quadricarinatus]XP_053648319.1 bis(5'-nucleosyl)-tetraphosphatase [asymmetrical]-like [Cherax quadricarinatus]XP_053648320.1 bis(5'-nucleosyl)-tetraphosphatase [asymmetrical]-like [Cherax quadricarinatus]XP_053648321.1 bis(5'-nucleosyl)-tetraph
MSRFNKVRASGLIIFRRVSEEFEYLLLKSSRPEGHWTPPKGHVDRGESEMEAAIRETEEEAGLRSEQLTVIDGFQRILEYNVEKKPKSVVYWAAELKNPTATVSLSNEHVEFSWAPLAKSCDLAGFPDLVSALEDCEEFLQNFYSK